MLFYAIHVQLFRHVHILITSPQPIPSSPLCLPCSFSSSVSLFTDLSGAMSHIHPSPLSPRPFITNTHRCSHSHREKGSGGERVCEGLCIRLFGFTTREHKAIGLVLLGAKSSYVLIGTEKGSEIHLCVCVCAHTLHTHINVHTQVLCAGTNTLWQS